jgi:hypothetical protein
LAQLDTIPVHGGEIRRQIKRYVDMVRSGITTAQLDDLPDDIIETE